jgi:phosphoserine phosphatase RsbU/P
VDEAEEFYEEAPCGYLSALPSGDIVRVNRTLERWTGYTREQLLGRRFVDLLAPGARIYHETHYAPLLRMQGSVSEIALDLVRADGSRLPVLVNSILRTDAMGAPQMVRTTIFAATQRRAYEEELLRERERERTVARRLQESLLALPAPRDERFAVAARYLPSEAGLDVGGDWHQTFMLDADTVAVAVGDVVGRGLDAASTMGQLRSATRALAGTGIGAARVLEQMSWFVQDLPLGPMTTVAYAELDLKATRLSYACAGHPPPLLVLPNEPATLLWDGRSPPLGAIDGARVQAEIALQPNARLLIYTDGLVERRRVPLDTSLERLAAAVDAHRDDGLEELLDALVAELLPGRAHSDDVCVLALECLPHPLGRDLALDRGAGRELRDA